MIRFFLLGFGLVLSGCAGKPPLTSSSAVSVYPGDSLPPPDRNDLRADNRAYFVGPFDKLRIDVFGVEDLRREVQIDASGRLSFPLVGVVEASGLTPGELADTLEERLRGRYIRNPQVTVNLEETVSQVVSVDGQVEDPGLYPVIGRMTLMRAISRAGGTSEYADLEDVVVFRRVGGQQLAALYNLKAIRRGQYVDPEVFANDVVVVGDSQARRLFDVIIGASPLLTTPLVILTQ